MSKQHIGTANTGAGLSGGTEEVVKTGDYSTGLERGNMGMGMQQPPVPIVGNSYQNRVSGIATAPAPMAGIPVSTSMVPGIGSGNGLVVNNTSDGPVVLGGQCECTMNGGTCQHASGKCICRGCTTRATTVNPGVNLGISTTQYTAPVSTIGIGGGVGDPGVGIAGMVQPLNASGYIVQPSDANCVCVKNGGICDCPPGGCKCEHCGAKRSSHQHTAATGKVQHHHSQHHIDTSNQPIGGTEYVGSPPYPDAAYKSANLAAPSVNRSGGSSPLTDNSNVPY